MYMILVIKELLDPTNAAARKKPFSGKAKKQQLRDKRARERAALDAEDAVDETETVVPLASHPVSPCTKR